MIINQGLKIRSMIFPDIFIQLISRIILLKNRDIHDNFNQKMIMLTLQISKANAMSDCVIIC